MDETVALRRTIPPDAAFGDWRAPDGWRYRRMDWRPAEGVKSRGSILFAGGRGDFIEKYLEVYAHWRAAGWQVTAFDWRGQGQSRGDMAGGNYGSFDVLIDDLGALIADWQAAAPGPHAAVGHSMGGHLLLRTLIDKRPQLDAAVLVAPMLSVNSAPTPAWLAPAMADAMCLLGWQAQPVWRVPLKPAPPGSTRQRILTGSVERYLDEAYWWERHPHYSLGAPSWGWLRAAFRSSAATFTPGKLAAVDLPVLLLSAPRDRLVSPAAIARAARLMPRAELAEFPEAAHEILREADPVRLAALARIDAFLAEHAQ